MDVSQYLEIFIEETKEHIQTLNDQMLVLESEPENEDTINEIFRAAHSLKGMAGTMGYKRMQRLTHDMESVFQEIRSGNMKVSSLLMDGLFKGIDAIEGYLQSIISSGDEGTNDNQSLLDLFGRILSGDTGTAAPEAAPEAAPAAEEAPAGGAAAAAATATKEAAKPTTLVKIGAAENEQIAKAAGEGKKAFMTTVFINNDCVLRAARAFLVVKAVEALGTIISTNPSMQDVEDERFDFEFTILVATDAEQSKIFDAVMNVSEIANCVIEEVKATAPKEEVKEEAKDDKAAKADKSAAAKSKPVVNRSVRVDIEKLDDLMNLVSELIIEKNKIVSISSSDVTEQLERITSNIHTSVMKVRMVPIESVVNRFPRMIRDLSKKLDKKMELHMSGEETELDRTVIDEIGDPLMHLLRNSADHGLESNEERVKKGKSEVGNIWLDAYQEGNNVVIEVRDDGAGINLEKVKNKAIANGLYSKEQADALTEKEIIDILFRPSFSTADVISDVSGRGVGLDVVKSKIESLSGNIEAKTVAGEGSTFTIRLPLTLAIIQSLMVTIGDEKYAIPLPSIQTIEDVPTSDVKLVQNKEVINLRGTVVPILRLDDILDIPNSKRDAESLTVVIVTKGERLAGLVVDDLIGQLEIVIKSIGKYINNSKMISGATILGDGEIALILDVNNLV